MLNEYKKSKGVRYLHYGQIRFFIILSDLYEKRLVLEGHYYIFDLQTLILMIHLAKLPMMHVNDYDACRINITRQ